jgi:hypothetical protein
MKLKWNQWLYGMVKSVVGGVAATGGSYLGTLVLLFSSLTNLFFYLQKSPVPDESTGNTDFITKPPTPQP